MSKDTCIGCGTDKVDCRHPCKSKIGVRDGSDCMRSRKTIEKKVWFKKQFQGTLANEVMVEALLDIRELLLLQNGIREFDLELKESEEAKNQ